MGNTVARYHGVDVVESCGYYYPSVNGNVECKTIREVKDWIERIWVPVMKGMDFLADRIGVSRATMRSTFISLMP